MVIQSYTKLPQSDKKGNALERAFDEFRESKNLNLLDEPLENEEIRIEPETKESIIKRLKEMRESSKDRIKGKDLEKRTNDMISKLKCQIFGKQTS